MDTSSVLCHDENCSLRASACARVKLCSFFEGAPAPRRFSRDLEPLLLSFLQTRVAEHVVPPYICLLFENVCSLHFQSRVRLGT